MSPDFPSPEAAPRAIIVEDEPALRAELKEMLAVLWPELDIVAETHDGLQALALIERHQPDLLFLDIQIPGPGGLDIARHVNGRIPVVFVTAYDSHAIEAFDHGAVDYLLKPLDGSRLARTVERLKQRLGQAPSAPAAPFEPASQENKSGHLRWITASVGNSLRLITIDEVVFFQSEHKYTRVVLAESEVLIKKTLKELLAEIDPDQFWQIHRSTIVNAQDIASIELSLRGHLSVKLKSRREQLPVSESFARRFRQM